MAIPTTKATFKSYCLRALGFGVIDINVSDDQADDRIDEALQWADVVNILRIQRERMGIGLIPSIREYRNLFGVTKERLQNLDQEITIMHPGPINRGVELSSDVADSKYAIILDQVENGVAIRMAVLYLLAGRIKDN